MPKTLVDAGAVPKLVKLLLISNSLRLLKNQCLHWGRLASRSTAIRGYSFARRGVVSLAMSQPIAITC